LTINKQENETSPGNRIILVVEDDEELCEVIVAALRGADYIVASAGDGQQALALMATGFMPCLVLSDVMMPVMTGLELREHMLADARLSTVPLVLMTAGGFAVELLMRELGVTLMRKPVSTRTLLDTVASHCADADGQLRGRGDRRRSPRPPARGSAGRVVA
jgi:CheY-like chemotaxis protein